MYSKYLCGRISFNPESNDTEVFGFALRYCVRTNTNNIQAPINNEDVVSIHNIPDAFRNNQIGLVCIRRKIEPDMWISPNKEDLDKLILNKVIAHSSIIELHRESNLCATNLVSEIIHSARMIAVSTRRGIGNIAIINHKFYELLNNLPITTDTTDTGIINNSSIFNKIIDNEYFLLNSIKIFIEDFNEDTPEILIGYSNFNRNYGDGGVIEVINSYTGKVALVDDFIDTQKYYIHMRIVD